MQEAIIEKDVWERVQELRKNKRRLTATGRTSLFSGLVYCPDCGAKLYFCATKSFTRQQEHFCCSNYKSGRGTCKIHYIRDVVLEQIVQEAISDLAAFVRCYESTFLYMVEKQHTISRESDLQLLKATIANSNKRIREIDRAITKLVESNMEGQISDERFMTMTADYEAEQRSLKASVADAEEKLAQANQGKTDLRMLLKGIREFSEIKQLMPEIVNTLIQRIEVHNNDKSGGHCYVKVDIYFTAIGLFSPPSEEELAAEMAEYAQTVGA